MHQAANAKPDTVTPAAAVRDPERFAEQQPEQRHEGPEGSGPLQIQCKLSIGAADDPLEREADAVAERVMRMPDHVMRSRPFTDEPDPQLQRNADVIQPFIIHKANGHSPAESASNRQTPMQWSPALQKKCAACEEEDKDTLRRKPLSPEAEAQDLPAVATSGAERPVATSAEQPQTALKAAPLAAPKNMPTPADSGGSLQLELELEEKYGEISMKAFDGFSPEPPDDIEGRLNQAKGSGYSLPDGVRAFMEQSIGADFSAVKIHNDADAAGMSQALNAHAFTHGSDIYFNSGRYAPSTSDGMQLLAHELTHTVQQNASAAKSMRFGLQAFSNGVGEIGLSIQRQTDPTSLDGWIKLPESVFVVVKSDTFFKETPVGNAIPQSRILITGDRLELTWKNGDWYYGYSEYGAKGYVEKSPLVFPPQKMPLEEFAGIIGDILFIQAKDMNRAFVLAKKSGLKPNIGMVFWYSNGKVKPYPVKYEIAIREPSAEELERMQRLAGFSMLGSSGSTTTISGGLASSGLTPTPQQKKWQEAEKELMPYAEEYLLAASKTQPGEMLMNVPTESYFESLKLFDRFCDAKGIKKDPSDPDFQYYITVLLLLIRAKIKEVITPSIYKPTDKMLVAGTMEWWIASKQLLVLDNDTFLKAELQKIIKEENEKRKADIEAFFKPYKDRFKVEQDEFLAKAKAKIDATSGWYQQEVERKAAMEVLKKRQDEYMDAAVADFQKSAIAKEIQQAVEKRYAAVEKTITSPDPYSNAVIKGDTVLVGMLKYYDQKLLEAADSAAQAKLFESLRDKVGTYLSTTYPDSFKSLLRIVLVYFTEKLLVKPDGKISIYAIKNWAKLNSDDLKVAIDKFSPIFHKRLYKDSEYMDLISTMVGPPEMGGLSMTGWAYTDLGYELAYAREFFDNVVSHPENDEGFWDGFSSKSLGEFLPFIHSILQISKLYEVMRVSNKSLMGGTLTLSEQLLLQAFAALQQVQAMKAKPFWYKVGEGVADAIPFIGEFVITAPLGLGTAEITEKAMEATVRNLAVQYLEKRMVKFIIKGVGVLAGSLVQTLANPLDIEKNILANRMNIVSLVQNEDGSFTVEVKPNQDSEAKAVWNGFISSYINVFTERLGGKVLPFVGSKVAGAFGRFVPMVVRDRIVTASMKKVAESLSKYAGFHGILGEYEEEVYGQILEALLTGKQLKWNSEDQLQTFTVVAILGTAMRGLQTTVVAYEIIRTFRMNNRNVVLPAEVYTMLTRLTSENSFEVFKRQLAAMKLSNEQRELAMLLAQRTLNVEHEIALSEQEDAALHPKVEMPKTLKELHKLIISLYSAKKLMLLQLQQGQRVAESVLLFGDSESVPLILYNVDQANQWIKETETAIENLESTSISDAKMLAGVADGVLENIAFWGQWAGGWRPYIEQTEALSPNSTIKLTDDMATVNINGNILLTPKMLQRLLLLEKGKLQQLLAISLQISKTVNPGELSAENLAALRGENADSSVKIADNSFVNINDEAFVSKAVLEKLLPEAPKKPGDKFAAFKYLFSQSRALSFIDIQFSDFTPNDHAALKALDPASQIAVNAENRLEMNGQIELSASFVKELMAKNSVDVKKLLEATRELNSTGGNLLTVAEPMRKVLIQLSSSSSYRMRFKFQYGTELNAFINAVGIAGDPRFQPLWAKASFEEKIRLWDLYNESGSYNAKGGRSADTMPEMRRQAMDFALTMKPANLFELVEYYQYYKSSFLEGIERLKNKYKEDLAQALLDYKTAHSGTDATPKEKENIEKKLSADTFGTSFSGLSNAFKEAAYNKIAEQMRDPDKGAGFISADIYQLLAGELQGMRVQTAGKIGKAHIAPGMNDQDTVKALANLENLTFSEEPAFVYHVLKHHGELPETMQNPGDPAGAYLDAARKAVKQAAQVTISFAPMENGTRSISFSLSSVRNGKPVKLIAIVRCEANGDVYFATLLIPEEK